MHINKITAVAKHNIATADNSTNTKEQYKKTFNKFAEWVKEQEGTYRVDPQKYHDLIVQYLSKYENPHTYHTHLSALCCGCGLEMSDFKEAHKKRGMSIKGRDVEGVRNALNERICRFAELTGIRKSEISRMQQLDITERDGYTYVIVRKGKGGKYQEQMILPEYVEEVKGFYQQPQGEDGYLFSREEVRAFKNANPHRLRRLNAWKSYKYFLEYKPEWRSRLKETYLKNPKKKADWYKYVERVQKSPIYELRGERRALCEKLGIAYRLDREAVMMTSVFMLSHYREQVTVDNYLLDGMLGR